MHFEEIQGIKYYKECTVPWLLSEAKQYHSIFFWSGGWMGGGVGGNIGKELKMLQC